jgi:hypothetical protein
VVVSPSDPTTAGSETPAGPSRRRSLPALGKVQESVADMAEEARRLGAACARRGEWRMAHFHAARLIALCGVLEEIDGVGVEAPEGNMEVRRPADSQ